MVTCSAASSTRSTSCRGPRHTLREEALRSGRAEVRLAALQLLAAEDVETARVRASRDPSQNVRRWGRRPARFHRQVRPAVRFGPGCRVPVASASPLAGPVRYQIPKFSGGPPSLVPQLYLNPRSRPLVPPRAEGREPV